MHDYEDFIPAQRLGGSLSVSADGTMIAYASDASGQFNLWTQPTGGGPARQLTFFTDHAVREVAWAPDGTRVAFTADTQGDEQYQVYLTPAGGGEPAMVSRGSGQHFLAEKAPFGSGGQSLMYSGPGDDPAVPDVIVTDLDTGAEQRWHGPANVNGFAIAISPDGRHVMSGVLASNTVCRSYLAAADVPGTALDAVTACLPGEYYYPGPWARDSKSFYVLTTDADHDHVSLARFRLEDRELSVLDSPPWDVEDVVASADGRTLVWSVNQDGYSVLRAERDGGALPLPPVPGGVITSMSISGDGTVLAVRLDAADRPACPVVLHLGTSQPPRYLTGVHPAPGGGGGPPRG
jgi:Tol biopolymer transport system component